jgi:hypothetical protein
MQHGTMLPVPGLYLVVILVNIGYVCRCYLLGQGPLWMHRLLRVVCAARWLPQHPCRFNCRQHRLSGMDGRQACHGQLMFASKAAVLQTVACWGGGLGGSAVSLACCPSCPAAIRPFSHLPSLPLCFPSLVHCCCLICTGWTMLSPTVVCMAPASLMPSLLFPATHCCVPPGTVRYEEKGFG